MTKTRITMVTEHEGQQIETVHIVVSEPYKHSVACVTTSSRGATLKSFPKAVERAAKWHGEYTQGLLG
jgi:hypothetical protein